IAAIAARKATPLLAGSITGGSAGTPSDQGAPSILSTMTRWFAAASIALRSVWAIWLDVIVTSASPETTAGIWGREEAPVAMNGTPRASSPGSPAKPPSTWDSAVNVDCRATKSGRPGHRAGATGGPTGGTSILKRGGGGGGGAGTPRTRPSFAAILRWGHPTGLESIQNARRPTWSGRRATGGGGVSPKAGPASWRIGMPRFRRPIRGEGPAVLRARPARSSAAVASATLLVRGTPETRRRTPGVGVAVAASGPPRTAVI